MMAIAIAYPKRAGFDSTPAKMKPRAETMNRKTPRMMRTIGSN